MSLSDADFVQENSGSSSVGTSHVVTLPSGTTVGNTLVVAMYTGGSAPDLPTGFVSAGSQGAAMYVRYKPDLAAGETSWTFTTVGSVGSSWYVAEVAGLDPADPVDVTVGASPSVSNGGTGSTGTTALDASLYTVALAVFGTLKTSGANTVSWSGFTNGFDEVADVDSSNGTTLAAARLFESSTTRTFETTGTLATNDTARTVHAMIVVFRAVDSPVVAPLSYLAGFEWGTHGGGSPSGATSMFGGLLAPGGTWGTNYLIQAGSARNSNYGLQVTKSAAIAYVVVGSFSSRGASFGFNVRVVSATGTVVVAELSGGAQLLYDSAATKFGVRCGSSGTASWQSGTTAINTWVWVDCRCKTNTTTHHAEWRIETGTGTYTGQTAADRSGASAINMQYLALGGTASATSTIDFDDVVLSGSYAAYPLGPIQVRLLTVDPAGTPTVSGTTTNFSVFTANGTLGAWNATNARNALDEAPPTVSASADGVTQTTTAASDYMEFPMATYTLGPTEFVNGVRMLAPLWSGSGAGAGDLAIRGYDGTLETALATASAITPGAPTAVSSTAPVWRCAMWPSTNGWTQAELDAAALRVGFSGDATPDMGVSAIYLEAAIGKTTTRPLFGDFATIEEDPTRLGVVSVTTTAPDAGGDSSLYYETSGTPTTVPVPDATTVTTQLNAEDQPTTNYIAFYPPPEGVPDA